MLDQFITRIFSSIARSLDDIEQGRKAGTTIAYKHEDDTIVITIIKIEDKYLKERKEDEQD